MVRNGQHLNFSANLSIDNVKVKYFEQGSANVWGLNNSVLLGRSANMGHHIEKLQVIPLTQAGLRILVIRNLPRVLLRSFRVQPIFQRNITCT